MQRLIYRNFGDHESILAVHSINTSAGAGGVRWYEFRLDAKRDPVLYQQGTYAPDQFYRWMASPGMDRAGNIGIGYSFGGTPNYAGQRFAARMAGDPRGQLNPAGNHSGPTEKPPKMAAIVGKITPLSRWIRTIAPSGTWATI